MVHLTSGERLGLLSRASITISILCLRTFGGVVSGLPALEIGNVTQVFLGGCRGVGTALTIASSILITILRDTMVV